MEKTTQQRLAELNVSLKELSRQIEAESKYGDEGQFKEGDVITFMYAFPNRDTNYQYAAILTRRHNYNRLAWHLSGAINVGPLTWPQLLQFWERGTVSKLKVATSFKRIH